MKCGLHRPWREATARRTRAAGTRAVGVRCRVPVLLQSSRRRGLEAKLPCVLSRRPRRRRLVHADQNRGCPPASFAERHAPIDRLFHSGTGTSISSGILCACGRSETAGRPEGEERTSSGEGGSKKSRGWCGSARGWLAGCLYWGGLSH